MSVDKQNQKAHSTINKIQGNDKNQTSETSYTEVPIIENRISADDHSFDEFSQSSGRISNGFNWYNLDHQAKIGKEISGNFESARQIINPETYRQRMNLIASHNWEDLGEVMTQGTASKPIAQNLVDFSKNLDRFGHVFSGVAVAGDTVSEYLESGGDLTRTGTTFAVSSTWNFGAPIAAAKLGATIGAVFGGPFAPVTSLLLTNRP